jgi:hypothetical protein
LSTLNCAWEYPASAKAAVRYGASKSTYRVDDVVSGRMTPTCRLFDPLVAKPVRSLNWDMVALMSLVNEATVTFGTVLDPVVLDVELPHAATTTASVPAAAITVKDLTFRKLIPSSWFVVLLDRHEKLRLALAPWIRPFSAASEPTHIVGPRKSIRKGEAAFSLEML